MKAFYGSEEIKAKYLARIRAHRAADEIIQGKYWDNGNGCAVWCTIHSDLHQAYETELGIPRVLARLEDGIFEGLPNELALTWPERFLEAIQMGVDLSQVWPKFVVWLLVDKKWGVVQFAKTKDQKKSIFAVAKAYKRRLKGFAVSADEWLTLRGAASEAAAAAAADAAAAEAANAEAANAEAANAEAANAEAAGAAAYAAGAAAGAAYDAAGAAYDAAGAVFWGARIKWRIAQSEKLLKLLRESK